MYFNEWKTEIDKDKPNFVLISHEEAEAFSRRKNYLLSLGYQSVGDIKTKEAKWESYDTNFFDTSYKCGGGTISSFYQEFKKI